MAWLRLSIIYPQETALRNVCITLFKLRKTEPRYRPPTHKLGETNLAPFTDEASRKNLTKTQTSLVSVCTASVSMANIS
jgi:hypothetical protein